MNGLTTTQMAGLAALAVGGYMIYQKHSRHMQHKASCKVFDQLPQGEFAVGGTRCTCSHDAQAGAAQRLTFCPVGGKGVTAVLSENLDGPAVDGNMTQAPPVQQSMQQHIQSISELTTHLPSVNPMASIPLAQRLGAINPVKFNEWHDPRGAPRVLQHTTITEEQAFLKHPRAIDSYLDKQELIQSSARGPRVNVFV